jgi:hypothetical protein
MPTPPPPKTSNAEAANALTETSVIAATPDQVSSDLRDEKVILHLEDGTYYGLNAVGARIWDLIQEPTTVREVREQLVHEYDVEAETCQRDLMAVLRDLADHHLIEIRGDEGR